MAELLDELKNSFKDGYALCVYSKTLGTVEINDGRIRYTIAYNNDKSVMANNNGDMWLVNGNVKTIADKFSKIIKKQGNCHE